MRQLWLVVAFVAGVLAGRFSTQRYEVVHTIVEEDGIVVFRQDRWQDRLCVSASGPKIAFTRCLPIAKPDTGDIPPMVVP